MKERLKSRGKQGEELVIKYVISSGMSFLEANYHSIYGEIDIICEDKDCIVFVEVKTRKESALVSGFESVDKRKRDRIIKTAYLYIQENLIDMQPRFDVAEVRCDAKGNFKRINYISNAFDLEGYDEFF